MYPILGQPLGYVQLGAWNANVLTGASWAAGGGGKATYTTTTAHGVLVGQSFTITGCTPAGYNGTFIAITGTTGSTLVAAMATNPGTETVLGTLAASLSAATVLPVPAGTSMAVIAATGDTVRWLDTGTPTALLGQPIAAGNTVAYFGNVRNLQLISGGSATLDVSFYG